MKVERFFPQKKSIESANQPPHDLTNIDVICASTLEFRNSLVSNLAYAQAVFARFCVVKSLTFEITLPKKQAQAQHTETARNFSIPAAGTSHVHIFSNHLGDLIPSASKRI